MSLKLTFTNKSNRTHSSLGYFASSSFPKRIMLYSQAHNKGTHNNTFQSAFPLRSSGKTDPLTPSAAFICGYRVWQLPFLDPTTIVSSV